MEFKGTRRLTVDLKNNKVLNSNGVLIIANINEFDEKAKYDTLLYSKAPEMLEMLHKAKLELSRIKGSMMAHPDCVQGSEFDDYTDSAEEVENEIEQLIKQATEL